MVRDREEVSHDMRMKTTQKRLHQKSGELIEFLKTNKFHYDEGFDVVVVSLRPNYNRVTKITINKK